MKIINLLPKDRQMELRYESMFHSVIIAVVLAVIILLLGVAAQFALWVYLGQQQVVIEQSIEQIKTDTDKQENAELKNQIKLVNNQMKDYSDLATVVPQWSKVISAFSKYVPEGVKIAQFQAEAKTGRIDINGQSPTREQVIELYNNINGDTTTFKDIDYPLENVAKPTDIAFRFTFYVRPDALPFTPAAPAAAAQTPKE